MKPSTLFIIFGLFCLISVFIAECSKNKSTNINCSYHQTSDGIYAKPVGTVLIDGQNCGVFEINKAKDCSNSREYDWENQCYHSCRYQVLTQTVKCNPNNTEE